MKIITKRHQALVIFKNNQKEVSILDQGTEVGQPEELRMEEGKTYTEQLLKTAKQIGQDNEKAKAIMLATLAPNTKRDILIKYLV